MIALFSVLELQLVFLTTHRPNFHFTALIVKQMRFMVVMRAHFENARQVFKLAPFFINFSHHNRFWLCSNFAVTLASVCISMSKQH